MKKEKEPNNLLDAFMVNSQKTTFYGGEMRKSKINYFLFYVLQTFYSGAIIGLVFGVCLLQAGVAINTRTGEKFQNLQRAIKQADSDDILELSGTFKTNKTFTINKGLTLIGIERDVILDGANKVMVLKILSNVTVKLKNLTIQNGFVKEGNGGGIFNQGNLTLHHVNVINNQCKGEDSLNTNGNGGGIFTVGNLYIIDSTISHNVANRSGGGIAQFVRSLQIHGGELIIQNSKITHNQAKNEGGGVQISTGGDLRQNMVIENCKINNNEVDSDFGIGGGVLFRSSFLSSIHFKNCEIKNNRARSNGGGIWACSNDISRIFLENVDAEHNTPNNIFICK